VFIRKMKVPKGVLSERGGRETTPAHSPPKDRGEVNDPRRLKKGKKDALSSAIYEVERKWVPLSTWRSGIHGRRNVKEIFDSAGREKKPIEI